MLTRVKPYLKISEFVGAMQPGFMNIIQNKKNPGQTGYTAEHAQQILEGFPKPPPAAPKPPTATTEMLVDTEVIEEFPEEQQPKGLEKLLKVSAL